MVKGTSRPELDHLLLPTMQCSFYITQVVHCYQTFFMQAHPIIIHLWEDKIDLKVVLL